MAKLCKPRKKAFIGAAISAGTSILGGVIGGIKAKTRAKQEAELLESNRLDLENQNKSINLAQAEVASEARRKLYETQSEYAMGGKKSIGKDVKITDGGYAKPVAKDTYKLVGRKHSTGGIGIKTASDEIEAESGEVVVRDGGELKILSDRVLDGSGKTPSDKVMTNPSKSKAKAEFNKQEYIKRNNPKLVKQMVAAEGASVKVDPKLQSSEDIDNPAYSKKTPMSIKDQEKLIIEDARTKGLRNFEKATIAGKAIANAHPIAGTALDLIDMAENIKNKNYTSATINATGVVGKASEAGISNSNITPKTARSKFIGKRILGGISGSILALPDVIKDTKDAIEDFNKVDSKYANGGSVNLNNKYMAKSSSIPSRRKAATGDKIKTKASTTDILSQGVALAAPIISGLVGMNAANKMTAPTKPKLMTPTRLVTDVNTNATKSEIQQDYKDLSNAIEANTASSSSALARRQKALNAKYKQFRSVDENARNREVDLINKDLANKQSVSAYNLQTSNAYNKEVADFKNKQELARAEGINQIIGGGRDAVLDIQNRADLDRYNKNRLDIANSLSTRPKAIDNKSKVATSTGVVSNTITPKVDTSTGVVTNTNTLTKEDLLKSKNSQLTSMMPNYSRTMGLSITPKKLACGGKVKTKSKMACGGKVKRK